MAWTAEQKRSYRRAYYLAHKDAIKAKVLAWQKSNPDKLRENSKAWKKGMQLR